jgi:hypothetical protein
LIGRLQIHRFPVPAGLYPISRTPSRSKDTVAGDEAASSAAVCSSTGISPAHPLPVGRDTRNLQVFPRRHLKPAKGKSTERIDGIVALIMALGRAAVAQEEPLPEYSLHFD